MKLRPATILTGWYACEAAHARVMLRAAIVLTATLRLQS
jgi:hypothetical protein